MNWLSRCHPSLWFPSIKEYENWSFLASCCDIPSTVTIDCLNTVLPTKAKLFLEIWFQIDIKANNFQKYKKTVFEDFIWKTPLTVSKRLCSVITQSFCKFELWSGWTFSRRMARLIYINHCMEMDILPRASFSVLWPNSNRAWAGPFLWKGYRGCY